jgi:hypothetical protein
MEPRTEDRAMSARSVTLVVVLLTVLAALVAACSPTAGALGTPNSPAITPVTTDGPAQSDVAPGSAVPAGSGSAASPSTPSSPSGKPGVSPAGSSPSPSAAPSASPAGTTIVRAYFMLGSLTGNPGLVPTLREIPKTQAVARAAMTELLQGPQGVELQGSPAMYTSIPDGTKLVDLGIANGTATVTLSAEFQGASQNFQLKTATAQVVYTLTQFSSIDNVTLVVQGGATQAGMSRSDFQEVGILPAIFVDRPAWGAAAGNPARVAGLANVFEATFRVQILDGKGNVLADKQVTATCGTGCWGSFKTDVGYTLGKAQYGTLRVFDLSAKDGTPENVTEYRVWLTPAS